MSKKVALYNIIEEMEALDKMLEESKGEITDEHQELIEYVENILTKKVDGCKEWHQQQKDLILLAKNRVKELQSFQKSIEYKMGRFEDYIKFCMEKAEIEKFQGQLHEIKFRKPSKKLEIIDEEKIPVEYVTVQTITTIDKKRLLADMKNKVVTTDAAKIVDGAKNVMFSFKKG